MTRQDVKPCYTEPRKTCFIYSSGGHYAELKKAIEGISFTNSYHVTFSVDGGSAQLDLLPDRYLITHPRRKVLRTLKNAWESLLLLFRMRPEIIISTGADVAVPTIILGKLLFRSTIIFVESGGSVEPTLTGKIVYPFSDLFIVPFPEKLERFPGATLSSGLLL